jgi:hypothetical protein
MICDRCDSPDAYANLDEVDGIVLLCEPCAAERYVTERERDGDGAECE